MDLIYRAFSLKTAEYTLCSSAHKTFSRTGHMLGQKASIGKFKKIEIIPSIFSNYNAVRLEIKCKKKNYKKHKHLADK